MRVALIWPNGQYEVTLPLGLALLKSNADNTRHDIRIFDCYLSNMYSDSPELARQIEEFDPHVVGVSSWTAQIFEALRILRTVKSINPNIVTVIGGVHPSAYPEKTIENQEIDFLFRGECELSFPVFLEQLDKETPDWSGVRGLTYRTPAGALVNNPTALEDDLDKIHRPDYDAANLAAYSQKWAEKGTVPFYRGDKIAPIWVTRGCPYVCQYCTAPIVNGRAVRSPSVEYVLEWVKDLYFRNNTRLILVLDDNFTFDVKFAKAVCRGIIALGFKDLKFLNIVGIRQERTDPELFGLMKQAGWDVIIIAPESGSPRTLEKMKKKMDPETIPGKVREIREAGIKAVGYFIIGYPGETETDLQETRSLIMKSRFNFVYLFSFRPLPGTPVYDELVANGELKEGVFDDNTYLTTSYIGKRIYLTKTLKDFNFSKFMFKVYSGLILQEPSNLFFMFKNSSPLRVVKRIVEMTLTSFMNKAAAIRFFPEASPARKNEPSRSLRADLPDPKNLERLTK